MRINFDVLLVILSQFGSGNRQDIGRMMRTCRTLYRAGIPYILEGEVKIDNFPKFIPFCYFMARTDPLRYCYLRTLKVDCWGDIPPLDNEDLFATFFRKAKLLKDLTIYGADMLFKDERVPCAISALTNLRSLSVHDYMLEPYEKMITSIQSPLVKLHAVGNDSSEFQDPFHLYQHLAKTLESLRVEHVYFESAAYLDVQFLKVTSLRIEEGSAECGIGDLYDAFPNLRELTVFLGNTISDPEEIEIIDEDRAKNLNEQEAGVPIWETLDRVTGEVLSIYELAIQSKIRWLTLEETNIRETSRGERFIRAILTDSQPSALTFEIDVYEVPLPRLGNLMAPALATLTAMDLKLFVDTEAWIDPNPSVVS